MFITPMFAAPMPKAPLDIQSNKWVAQIKYDGHRLIVDRGQDFPNVLNVRAWSRNGLARPLPPHLNNALAKLPVGIYDGELLVPGERSYGVTEIVNGPNLVFVAFDILEVVGVSTMAMPQVDRYRYLEEIKKHGVFTDDGPIRLAPTFEIKSQNELNILLQGIWAQDGEGVILKRKAAPYVPGKRPKDAWVKIKQLRSAVLEVIGFQPSRGEINYRGLYAMVLLRDEEGNETCVKTRNDEELRKFEAEASSDNVPVYEFTLGGNPGTPHPAIGRKLRIEYQERTPDGSYRHPRWDRWESE